MSEFTIEDTVKAKPETVFDVYLDHRGYADLLKLIRTAELEQEGEPPPNGLGAIRKLHLVGATVREEMTEYERPDRYSYRMLSGLPLDQFDATVSFTPTDEGTSVSYHVKVVGAVKALPVKWPSEEAIRMFMKSAAEKAETREAGEPARTEPA
ncbi:MAG TPA: SRPBCC family protein [Actinomycetota bacterium]|nr:SRPBCC family protein [Actinomycetota bacterium]